MQKPMFAAFLAVAAVVGVQAVANAEVTHSYPSYSVNMAPATTIITQPAVIEQSATICPQATTIVQPAVIEQSATICPQATTIVQPATVAAPVTTVVAAPVIQQTLIQPAIVPPAGFSMDPLALRLYTGPRLENTLTMPDANTFLRP
jgi:hypothetical protein